MGINLIWVCHDHGRYHYSMRGEEGIDFQALTRHPNGDAGLGCPAACFRAGRIRVYRDADFDTGELDEWWPVWEERPAEVHKRLLQT